MHIVNLYKSGDFATVEAIKYCSKHDNTGTAQKN